MNSSAKGGKKVTRFERSNGLDTTLYKKLPFPFFAMIFKKTKISVFALNVLTWDLMLTCGAKSRWLTPKPAQANPPSPTANERQQMAALGVMVNAAIVMNRACDMNAENCWIIVRSSTFFIQAFVIHLLSGCGVSQYLCCLYQYLIHIIPFHYFCLV